jgi:hypothetical protein
MRRVHLLACSLLVLGGCVGEGAFTGPPPASLPGPGPLTPPPAAAPPPPAAGPWLSVPAPAPSPPEPIPPASSPAQAVPEPPAPPEPSPAVAPDRPPAPPAAAHGPEKPAPKAADAKPEVAPLPPLERQVSGDEQRQLREEAIQQVGTAQRMAKGVKRDALGSESQDLLRMITGLVEQAEQALAAQMFLEAKSLAQKAITLTEDLPRVKP